MLLTYDDKSTVSVDEFSIDGTVQEISSLGGNRFLYWPDELSLGSHDVKVDAVDAAGVEAVRVQLRGRRTRTVQPEVDRGLERDFVPGEPGESDDRERLH